jgi:acetyl esterase
VTDDEVLAETRAFNEVLAAALAELPSVHTLPPAYTRAARRQGRGVFPPLVFADQAHTIEIHGRAGPISLRLVEPESPRGAYLHVHGGGWTLGSADGQDQLLVDLAEETGMTMVSVEYRLAPEHPFPAGHDDALAATKWAFDHAAEIGADPARIAVGGDSAGGNLAASVAVDLKDDPNRKLAFQLLLYPGTWPEEETPSRKALDGPILTKAALAWFDKCLGANGHPQAHRAKLAGADVAGVAPALVVTAGFDPLKDEGREYAERLKAAGVEAKHVEHPSLIHDFFVMAGVSPSVELALGETAAYLRGAIGG